MPKWTNQSLEIVLNMTIVFNNYLFDSLYKLTCSDSSNMNPNGSHKGLVRSSCFGILYHINDNCSDQKFFTSLLLSSFFKINILIILIWVQMDPAEGHTIELGPHFLANIISHQRTKYEYRSSLNRAIKQIKMALILLLPFKFNN